MKTINEYFKELNSSNAESICAKRPWIQEIAGNNGDLAAFLGDLEDVDRGDESTQEIRREQACRWKRNGLIDAIFETAKRPADSLDTADFIYEQHPEFWKDHLALLNDVTDCCVRLTAWQFNELYLPVIDILDEAYLEKCIAAFHQIRCDGNELSCLEDDYYWNHYWSFLCTQSFTLSKCFQGTAERWLSSEDHVQAMIDARFRSWYDMTRDDLEVLDLMIQDSGTKNGILMFQDAYLNTVQMNAPLMKAGERFEALKNASLSLSDMRLYGKHTPLKGEAEILKRVEAAKKLERTMMASFRCTSAFALSTLEEEQCREILKENGIRDVKEMIGCKPIKTGSRYLNATYCFYDYVTKGKDRKKNEEYQ
jgi:hypothetical protein